MDLSPDPVTRWDSYENLMQDTDTDDINGKFSIVIFEGSLSTAVTLLLNLLTLHESSL